MQNSLIANSITNIRANQVGAIVSESNGTGISQSGSSSQVFASTPPRHTEALPPPIPPTTGNITDHLKDQTMHPLSTP